MKLFKLCFLLLFSAIMCSCGKQRPDVVPDGFKPDVMLKMTPIKDHGVSSIGWCCAMLATIETEHLMQGDSVNLSYDYVARCYLRHMAELYFTSNGKSSLSEHGIGAMVPQILRRYGCLPYDAYHSSKPVNYGVLARRLRKLADISMQKHHGKELFMKDADAILDREIGYLPNAVFMLGAQYTPLEFAHSVCGSSEYQALTSTDDDDYSKPVMLSHDANTLKCVGRNLPRNSVFQYIKQSLYAHHPIMWTADTEEYAPVAIIGIGRDRHGREYFVGKNSRGTDNPTKGLLYIPAGVVKEHTAIAVVKRYI